MTAAGRAAIAGALREGHSFLLLCHELPDGDGVGATLGLALALDRLGKQVDVAGSEPVPRVYRFLPGADRMRPLRELGRRDWDAVVMLDCAEPARAGEAWELVRGARMIMNIDHHVTNSGFGHLNLVEPEASATSEQVHDLLEDLGVELDPSLASCLLTGIITDTGSFRYGNTTPRTFRVAARLMEAGARPEVLAARIWMSRHLSGLKLLVRALETLTLSDDGRIAWLTVDDAMLAATGADEQELEGLVNYPRSLEAVEVAILFRPMPSGVTRVALRSKTRADVSRVARTLGGGGHSRAAGCLLEGSLEAVVARVLAEARKEVSP